MGSLFLVITGRLAKTFSSSRTNVAPEPYSPSRRFAPRLAGDHYSPTRPLANDQYPVAIPPPSFTGDYFPQGPDPHGPPFNAHYGSGGNLGAPPPSGDYHPPTMGSTGPPFTGIPYSTGSGPHAPPFSGDHYSPLQELPGPPPPFSGEHYSPGRSLNGPQYTGDRYGRETPPIYPYMNPGSDSYHPRYDNIDTRAPHPPNPRWRTSSPERSQPSPGVVSPESPNHSARTWEMNRRTSLQGPNITTQRSPSPRERETERAPHPGRSITRSPSRGRDHSPLYSPHASPISFHGRPPRSPSPSRSPIYSPRASPSLIRKRDITPVRRPAPSPRGSPDPVRGRARSPIRGRAPLSPRSYVARLGRSRSRPPETYRPPVSRTRSPSNRHRPSYSRSRSSSYSADSYRRQRSSGRRRGRSRSSRSVSDTRGNARSRSHDRSRSKASTLYSPTTTRLYSPILSRNRLSRHRGKDRSRERSKRRGKRSNAAPKSARSPSSEDDLYTKTKLKRSDSAESAGSIYGPEIPPELRTKMPAQRTRDSSLSSYRSDNDRAKQQVTSIPGLSEVEQGPPAPPPEVTRMQDTPPSVAQETRTEDVERDQAPGLSDGVYTYICICHDTDNPIGTSLNDELRAAVAKLVSEHSTPRKEAVLSATGDVAALSAKDGVTLPPKDVLPKLSVQIPVLHRVASPQKKAEEEHEADESDMDLSMPTTPTGDAPPPTETVPVVVAESMEFALAAVPPSTEDALTVPVAQSVRTPWPSDDALISLSQPPHSTPLAVPQKVASHVQESHGSTGALPLADER